MKKIDFTLNLEIPYTQHVINAEIKSTRYLTKLEFWIVSIIFEYQKNSKNFSYDETIESAFNKIYNINSNVFKIIFIPIINSLKENKSIIQDGDNTRLDYYKLNENLYRLYDNQKFYSLDKVSKSYNGTFSYCLINEFIDFFPLTENNNKNNNFQNISKIESIKYLKSKILSFVENNDEDFKNRWKKYVEDKRIYSFSDDRYILINYNDDFFSYFKSRTENLIEEIDLEYFKFDNIKSQFQLINENNHWELISNDFKANTIIENEQYFNSFDILNKINNLSNNIVFSIDNIDVIKDDVYEIKENINTIIDKSLLEKVNPYGINNQWYLEGKNVYEYCKFETKIIINKSQYTIYIPGLFYLSNEKVHEIIKELILSEKLIINKSIKNLDLIIVDVIWILIKKSIHVNNLYIDFFINYIDEYVNEFDDVKLLINQYLHDNNLINGLKSKIIPRLIENNKNNKEIFKDITSFLIQNNILTYKDIYKLLNININKLDEKLFDDWEEENSLFHLKEILSKDFSINLNKFNEYSIQQLNDKKNDINRKQVYIHQIFGQKLLLLDQYVIEIDKIIKQKSKIKKEV